MSVIQAPVEFVEEIADLRLPARGNGASIAGCTSPSRVRLFTSSTSSRRPAAAPPNRTTCAWPGCNLHKSDRVDVPDPDSGATARLFHPRRDSWSDHFRWEEYRIVGLTPVGRATVFALDLNHPRRLLIRRAEELLQLFPPPALLEPGAS